MVLVLTFLEINLIRLLASTNTVMSKTLKLIREGRENYKTTHTIIAQNFLAKKSKQTSDFGSCTQVAPVSKLTKNLVSVVVSVSNKQVSLVIKASSSTV